MMWFIVQFLLENKFMTQAKHSFYSDVFPKHNWRSNWADDPDSRRQKRETTKVLDDLSFVHVSKLHDVPPQQLTKITWAFASLRRSHEPLFAAVVERLGEFSAREVANLAWGFGKLRLKDEAYVQKLTRRASLTSQAELSF